jgi:uric acid transporter
VASLPAPVIGGAATVMFAMVAAVGIRTLHKASFRNNHNMLIVAVALSFGMIPTVAPHFYENFPNEFQVIFGSGITATVIVVFVLNLLFNHWVRRPKADAAAGAPSGDLVGGHVVPDGSIEQAPDDGIEQAPAGDAIV